MSPKTNEVSTSAPQLLRKSAGSEPRPAAVMLNATVTNKQQWQKPQNNNHDNVTTVAYVRNYTGFDLQLIR